MGTFTRAGLCRRIYGCRRATWPDSKLVGDSCHPCCRIDRFWFCLCRHGDNFLFFELSTDESHSNCNDADVSLLWLILSN